MSDARARQDEVGARPPEPPLVVALAALRRGDLDGFSDWLHDTRFPTTPQLIDALRTLAETIVSEHLDAGFPPSATVDEIAIALAGRCGVPIADGSVAVARRGGTTDDRAAATEGVTRELAAARDEITRLRAERDALEARVDELAGARVLADALAAELERDEWLRARLRRLKDTRVARALLYARRRLRSRTRSSANR